MRFEAPAAERRLRGDEINCPACDAGEPIVLDVSARAAPASKARLRVAANDRRDGASGRRRRIAVTPPPLDMAHGTADGGPDAMALPRRSADEAPEIVYVDLEPPAPDAKAGAARSSGLARRAAEIGAGLVFIGGLAVVLSWPTHLPFSQGAQTIAARLAGVASHDVRPQAATPVPAGPVDGGDIRTASIGAASNHAAAAFVPPSPDLSIHRVTTEFAETDDGPVLSVRTDVRNHGDADALAPALRVSIRDAEGTILHRWTVERPGDGIDPGETRAILATTTRIPEGASDVKVDFARR